MASDGDKLSRTAKTEMALEIREYMMEGMTDGEIIEALGVSPQRFSSVKRFLLKSIGEEQEMMSSKERFAQYVLQVEKNVADLTDLVTNLNGKTQYNLLLGAIRLRGDFADRVIATGQTLGVIDKEPESKVIVSGVVIANLDEKELKAGVAKAISGLGGMLDKYGGTKLNELPPGDLHYGDSVDLSGKDEDDAAVLPAPELNEDSKGKHNKAKTSKRSAGRRRVKKKVR